MTEEKQWANKQRTANRRLAKKRVQWLNEALCFVSSSVLADSFVLRNPLLRQAPNRYPQLYNILQKMKLNLKSFTIFLSFTAIIACKKNVTSTDNKENISESKNEFLQSVNYSQEINLIQTDDRDGEWGGNTFIIRIYKNPESQGLLADYKELENKVETPFPPSDSNKFDSSNFGYGRKKIIVEKNNISLSNSEKIAIENSIIELIKSKINRELIPSHSGYVNKIIFSDSTLIVEDYPSIKWSNFKKLQKSLLEK